jgi:hypothetical protein
MAILKAFYDEKTLTEKVWYDSSMIVYSEFVEHENNNCGELFVTFKNGATYHYVNVDMVKDYIMFKNGGLDGSQGKALNKHIKPNYICERVDDKDVNTLLEEMNESCYEDYHLHTYFISGHRDITEQEFEKYKLMIYSTYINDPEARFVVADYHGADFMSQNYLIDVLEIDPDRVTVYHMGETPMNINPKITNKRGGFKTDVQRDEAMTLVSISDIAFVRDNTIISGTAENILRRFLLKDTIYNT